MFTLRVARTTTPPPHRAEPNSTHVTRAELFFGGHISTPTTASILDVSRTTMLVDSKLPVSAKSPIQVRFPKLIVFGEVTFCHRSDSSYRVGIGITDVASVHGLREHLESDQIESLTYRLDLK